MAGSSTTTDHDEIRKWAEARFGKPSTVRRTAGKDDIGVIRIDFPDNDRDEDLEEISWDEFFQKFDEKHLAMLYQDKKADGEPSYFSKFVSRDDDHDGKKKGHA